MKKLNQQVLEQFIKLTIRGEHARATRLMEKYISAKGAFLVNEENYGGDDPMFPARRELQRELEDDLDEDRVDSEDDAPELGGLDGDVDGEGPCPECGGEPCECEDGGENDADAVAKMVQDLIASGGLDTDKLAKIVDIIASDDDEEVEGDGLDQDGEVPDEVPASDEDEDEDPMADPTDGDFTNPTDGDQPDQEEGQGRRPFNA